MSATVFVLIGAGGTGSILFDPLVRYLSTHFRDKDPFILAVIDGDEIEPKNLDRQLFAGNAIGLNKADALVATYESDQLRAIPEFLSDDNIETRINDGDIVLIAADNFDVRARVQRRGMALKNITVINGGNENTDGSLQIWIRRKGKNITPPLSFMHDEILRESPHDPSKLNCQQRAEIPGGEQTIIANMMSATQILNAVRRVLTWTPTQTFGGWHELYFDLNTGNAKAFDNRTIDGWQEHIPK